jgi:hypothetical protein
MICLAIARERPVPPLAFVFERSTWWNCSKILCCSRSGTPGPVSATVMLKRPLTVEEANQGAALVCDHDLPCHCIAIVHDVPMT